MKAPDKSRVAIVIGARPNYPKIAVLKDLIPCTIIHSGQHSASSMSDNLLRELGITVDYWCGGGSPEIKALVVKVDAALRYVCPRVAVAVGDVNTAVATAIAATATNIRVAHIEAGMRSGDLTMPEEINRVTVDHLSDYAFATTYEAAAALAAEGYKKTGIDVVGNTMIDTLRRFETALKAPRQTRYVYVTLHRPALVDDNSKFRYIVKQISEIGIPVIWPRHPRLSAHRFYGIDDELIQVREPIGYKESLAACRFAHAVITDSGGLQEEAAYFGTPCFTVRNNTERPITLRYGNTIVGEQPKNLPELVRNAVRLPKPRIPMWDGNASATIASILQRIVE